MESDGRRGGWPRNRDLGAAAAIKKLFPTAKPLCLPAMTRAERAAIVDRRLAKLYPEPAIPLAHTDAFTLLIAVLLSAHTTDKSVNKATPELFALADTPAKMMRVPVAEIQRIIRPVGLSATKAQNISALARLNRASTAASKTLNFIPSLLTIRSI